MFAEILNQIQGSAKPCEDCLVKKCYHSLGSDVMEADDSPEEKLLQQLENCSDLDVDKDKIDSPEHVENGYIAEPSREIAESKTYSAINIETLSAGQINEAVEFKLHNIPTKKDRKKLNSALSISTDQSEATCKNAGGNLGHQSMETKGKTSKTSKTGGRRSSRTLEGEDSIISPKSSKKPRLSAEIAKKETASPSVSAENAGVSPGSKRLRKPKKMDIENEEVQKSPKPKPHSEKVVNPKAEIDVNLEAKFPGKLLDILVNPLPNYIRARFRL